VHAIVSGRVQGVGFRDFVLRRAEAQELSGWVRNMTDTRQVEFEAQGPERAVDDLIRAVHEGPLSARVTSVVVDSLPLHSSEEVGFEIR